MRDAVPFRRLIPTALLVLGLLPALTGCSKDHDVLIRIGQRVVTIEDFKAAARGNEAQYLGSPETAKAQLFDDLLRRELLLGEAEARGLFKDSALVKVQQLAEDQALRRALAAELAPKRIGVSDDEVKQLMAWQDTASHMLVIYTPTLASAEAARREIDGGAPFKQVADKFNPMGILPGGGDLGWGTPGSLVAPLDYYLRAAPVGKVFGPIEAPGEGWFVLQVIAREVRPQPDVVGRDAMVREQIRQRKQRLTSLETFNALQREYHFTREPDAATTLYQRIHPPAADQLKGMGGDVPVEPGGPKDPTRVLAHYEDGSGHVINYTMGDAVQDWEHTEQPPDPSNTAALDYWIAQQCMNRVLVLEARRRHLDEDPALRRQLEQGANNTILQSIYQSDVVGEADLIPGTVEEFYATVSDNFQRLESVTMESAMLSDSARAEMLVMHGGHAADLAGALAMFHQPATIEKHTVTFPSHDPTWQPLETTFLMVPPGQMGGPIAMHGQWLVYRVISKNQSAIPFEQLAPGQRQLVQARFDERRRDEALHRVTDHLMKTLKPELHPERLKRVPWPVDSPTGFGG